MDVYELVLDRLRGAPVVVSATLTSHKLIANSSAIGVAARTDETLPPPGSAEMNTFARSHRARELTIDDRFFATMGIPLLRGRVFVPADASGAMVTVVNRSLARQLFQTEDVVGRHLTTGTTRQNHGTAEIVGVVEDAHYTSIRDGKPPTLYLYYRRPPGMKNAATFEVRTAGAPGSFASTVREIVHDVDPALPVYGVMTQTEQIRTSLRQERLFARLATLLGGVALLLSAIGLYGLLAYNVTRRTAEIGVRMALGAPRARVLWMVLRQSLLLAALGLAAGVPLALTGTQILSSMLFGLAPRDPATMATAALAMMALAAAAGYLPARRAARVDPLVALRAD
jgi:predicted permease